MKRITLLMFAFVMMTIIAQAQKIDAIIDNGIMNPGQFDEANFRTFSLDICPVRLGWNDNLFGLYVQNDEYYAKDETQGWVSRMTQFHLGLSLNSVFGYNESWYLQSRLGMGWTRTNTRSDRGYYEDLQKDKDLMLSVRVEHWREDMTWFSRHRLNLSLRQPWSTTKTSYWEGALIDSPQWNNQLLRANFTETVFSSFLDKAQDWKLNADLGLGVGMEHQLQNNLQTDLLYPTLRLGVSFFKIPYFYQDMLRIGFEKNFNPMNRWMFTAHLNLVPVFHLIWDKETINIGGE